ncbi:MAG: hypothetical protein O6766_07905 [Gammaproteobacteria bacterium]|nr:hypothetical protein [Gammaproteobacteria bacterium]
MNRYLFTWECGAGLGHLARYRQLIALLLERGHEVMFASRNLEAARTVYGEMPVKLVQAPIHQRQPVDMFKPNSYVDVLINQGFEESDFKSRVQAWSDLFETWRPAVVIADHSPTVLLAQRLHKHTPCIVAGNGFSVPPVQRPFPPFDAQSPVSREDLIQREDNLLNAVVNPVLRELGGEPLEQCQQLFSPHIQWVFGLPRLDHYQCERKQTYLGASPSMGGAAASWPDTPGPRVFLYVKNHPMTLHVLQTLKELRWSTLIYAPTWSEDLRRAAESPSLRLSAEPLDLQSVARGCDLSVSNGGMNSVVELLLQGVPQLLLPLHIEQLMFARAAQTTGAVLALPLKWQKPNRFLHALEAAADPAGALKKAAVEFSENHEADGLTVQVDELVAQLEAVQQANER